VLRQGLFGWSVGRRKGPTLMETVISQFPIRPSQPVHVRHRFKYMSLRYESEPGAQYVSIDGSEGSVESKGNSPQVQETMGTYFFVLNMALQ
jgi:hypothetical protein